MSSEEEKQVEKEIEEQEIEEQEPKKKRKKSKSKIEEVVEEDQEAKEEKAEKSKRKSKSPKSRKNKESSPKQREEETNRDEEVLEEKDQEKNQEKNHENTEMDDLPANERPSIGMTKSMFMRAKEKQINPIQLVFKDIVYTVPIKKKVGKFPWQTEKSTKTILNHVSGYVNPGEMLAIMGSSGAGKTTLLNVLSARVTEGVEGQLLLNGNPRSTVKTFAKQNQAYIMQDDIMMKNQTPREILTFSALLRISGISKEEKLKRVDDIIAELGLQGCQNTVVGAPGVLRGISGGERKRVSIASELVTNPPLLFVDEPTSGLDSFTAVSVMKSLRYLAKSGRTVVCTIHQPNSPIFNQFDKLLLLAKGEVAYFGPAKRAIDYFNSIDYPCDKYVNPPDHFIKILHIDQSHKESEERVDSILQKYKNSEGAKDATSVEINHIPVSKDKSKHKGYATGLFTQVGLLFQRGLRDNLREPMKTKVTLGQTLFLSIIIGLIYLQITKDQTSVQNRIGSLAFILINQSFGSVIGLVSTFPTLRAVFVREVNNNMYRATAFYLANYLADLPFQIFFPFLFSVVAYFMIGYVVAADKFFIFFTTIILCSQIASSIGFLVGVAASDATVAISLVPLALLPFMIFSGFFVNTANVPDYFSWINYISFLKWGNSAVMNNELSGLTFTCSPGQICRYTTGDKVLEDLNFTFEVGYALLILLGMMIFWRVLGYFALLYRSKKSISNA